MLETIAIILVVLWILGLVTANTMGGFIHALLVIAVVVILIRVIQGRRVYGPWRQEGDKNHFVACGGGLVHLVSLIYLIWLVREPERQDRSAHQIDCRCIAPPLTQGSHNPAVVIPCGRALSVTLFKPSLTRGSHTRYPLCEVGGSQVYPLVSRPRSVNGEIHQVLIQCYWDSERRS